MSSTIFAYGVLMFEPALDLLTRRKFPMQNAVLHDYQRYVVEKANVSRVPVILPEPGAKVEGVLIQDVDARSMAILDDFEDSDMGLYLPTTVMVETASGETVEAQLYLGLEAARPHLTGIWDKQHYIETGLEEMLSTVIPEWLASRRLIGDPAG